jgi:hypothetical protein
MEVIRVSTSGFGEGSTRKHMKVPRIIAGAG